MNILSPVKWVAAMVLLWLAVNFLGAAVYRMVKGVPWEGPGAGLLGAVVVVAYLLYRYNKDRLSK